MPSVAALTVMSICEARVGADAPLDHVRDIFILFLNASFDLVGLAQCVEAEAEKESAESEFDQAAGRRVLTVVEKNQDAVRDCEDKYERSCEQKNKCGPGRVLELVFGTNESGGADPVMEKVDLRNLIFFRIGVRVVFHEALGGIFLCQRNGDDIAVAVLIVGNRGVQTGIGQVFRNLFGYGLGGQCYNGTSKHLPVWHMATPFLLLSLAKAPCGQECS